MLDPSLETLDTSTLDLENLLKDPEPLKKQREKRRVLTEDDLISNFPLLVRQAPYKNIHDLMNKIQLWGHEIMPRLTTLEMIENCQKVCQKKRMRIYKEEYQKNARYTVADLQRTVADLKKRQNSSIGIEMDRGSIPDYNDYMEFENPVDESPKNEFDQDELEFELANTAKVDQAQSVTMTTNDQVPELKLEAEVMPIETSKLDSGAQQSLTSIELAKLVSSIN